MKQFPSEQNLKEMSQDKHLTVYNDQLFIRQVCFIANEKDSGPKPVMA